MSRAYNLPMPVSAFYTYPDGMLVSLAGSDDPPNEVFYILKNIRHNITSIEHFRSLGSNMSQVVRLEAEEFHMIRLGTPMCSLLFPCPGVLTKNSSTDPRPPCAAIGRPNFGLLLTLRRCFFYRMGWLTPPSPPAPHVSSYAINTIPVAYATVLLSTTVKPPTHKYYYC